MADVDNAVNRPAESDALRDALGAAFDEIAGVCGDPEVPKSSIPAVKHSRKFYFNPNQQVHANRVMELEQLYREESKVKNDFQDHMMSRVWDPDTTKPAKGLTGNSVQQYIQQGPEFTNVEYAVLARRQYDQLTQRVDRHTRNNGLVVGVSALPDTQIPLHAREILEDFFERFGAANETEVYMLAVAFALPEHTIESFFESRMEISGIPRKIKWLFFFKDILLRTKRDGRLEQLKEKARNREIAGEYD